MADFGDILNAWEESGKKKSSRSGASSSVDLRKKDKVMQEDWLNLYPPEDKDSEIKGRSSGVRSRRRIDPAKLPVEDTIDLHGMTSTEAVAAAEVFLKNGVRRGFKKVLIIHGKGYHSPGGKSILKKEIRRLLERSSHVSTFGHGDRFNGGLGASWVLLNSKKKKA